MGTEVARTFLEIVSTGSLIRTAERLNVGHGQRTDHSLEQQLGRPLFVRSGTKAGRKLLGCSEWRANGRGRGKQGKYAEIRRRHRVSLNVTSRIVLR